VSVAVQEQLFVRHYFWEKVSAEHVGYLLFLTVAFEYTLFKIWNLIKKFKKKGVKRQATKWEKLFVFYLYNIVSMNDIKQTPAHQWEKDWKL
jgi:hypothetical protein